MMSGTARHVNGGRDDPYTTFLEALRFLFDKELIRSAGKELFDRGALCYSIQLVKL